MTIGERIKYLRKKNSMTQTDIAKKLNIATQTVFKYEKNIKQYSLKGPYLNEYKDISQIENLHIKTKAITRI